MKAKEEAPKVRQMPKGGRKGGTSFPRVSLTDALAYARKLVTKTHTGPQPQDVVYAGVVGSSSGAGRVRVAALKQYGLMKGDAKAGYVALELAKRISSAPPDEMPPLLASAALHPSVFKKIHDAFQGDTVSKAKLRQRAAALDVHPEETGTCVDLYVSALVVAGLATADGENVTHTAADHSAATNSVSAAPDDSEDRADEVSEDANHDGDSADARSSSGAGTSTDAQPTGRGPRAVFNVNVTLDSSLDTEKLERQLQLLKRYGAL